MWYWIIAVIAFIGAFAFVLTNLIVKTKKYNHDQEELKKNTPIIKANIPRVEEELKKAGFKATYSYSCLGYNFFDYLTKLGCPKNSNLQLDHENKLIACFMYLPYHFAIYKYEEVLKYELIINNGDVDISTTNTNIGTSIGGVGIGTGLTTGSASQTVISIVLMVTFTDGESFGLNFLNGMRANQGDDLYLGAIAEAKTLANRLDAIINNNKNK